MAFSSKITLSTELKIGSNPHLSKNFETQCQKEDLWRSNFTNKLRKIW